MKKLLLGLLTVATGFTAMQAQVTFVSGEITTNTTWTNNNIYQLNGFVYVEDGATLTIEEGTIIKGDKATKGTLIITKTGSINAVGTSCEPIVFTSNEPAGSRTYGDWGGVIILGEAPINVPGGSAIIEGGVDTPEGDGAYGGANASDNSGTFKYVRIEFAGIPFVPGNEINGLTMGGVGSGTTIDHIQISYSGDDSFEWFGGSVNAKYLIAYRGFDDDFDTDFGYSGKVQFGYVLRDPNVGDVSGSNGFESDNDATGSGNTPISRGLFSNITIAGPKVNTGDVINVNYKRGAHQRRNTMTSIYNSIIMGYPEAGFKIEGTNTSLNAAADNLQFKNNILSGNGDDYLCTTCDAGFNIDTYGSSNGNQTILLNSGVGLVNAFNLSNPDPRPTAGSAPTTIGTYFAGLLSDPFFTATSYAGAFSTTNNWTDESWVNFDPQSTPYSTPGINNNPTIAGTVSSMTCPNTGSIDVTPSGGVGIYTYAWSDGPTTQDRSGLAAGSYTITVTSNGCSAAATFTVNDVTVQKPTALVATEIKHCSAKISWNAAPGATTYEVRYAITGGTYSSPVNVGAVTNYTFTGLLANTSYDFQIRSKCATAEKSAWAKKTATTALCSQVTGIVATGITSSSAIINWSDVCGTNNYTVQYRKFPIKPWTSLPTAFTDTKTITGLLASSVYQVRIITNCGGGASTPTAFISFTTLPLRLENNVIVDENLIQINPNPASENVELTIEANGTVNVSIVNMVGQVVYENNNILVDGFTTIDLSVNNLESGIYLVNVNGNNINVTKELVISK